LLLDYITITLDWFEKNPNSLYGMIAVSVVLFIASLIIIPWLIIKLPEDYFINECRHTSQIHRMHPALYYLIRIGKNLLGFLLIFSGLIMFILPGQGILTMLIGITLTDFPGKFRLERWFIKKPTVFNAINWVRNKAKKPELINPHPP